MRVRILQLDAETDLGPHLLASLPAPFRSGEVVRVDLPLTGLIDPARGQVDAALLLDQVPAPERGWVVLALLGRDLFLPALTYVFGASALGRHRAVLSWARLVPDERPLDRRNLQARLSVETAHELGHAVGLRHCPLAACPMSRTLWPEAIDLKDRAYCPTCRAAIDAHLLAAGGPDARPMRPARR